MRSVPEFLRKPIATGGVRTSCPPPPDRHRVFYDVESWSAVLGCSLRVEYWSGVKFWSDKSSCSLVIKWRAVVICVCGQVLCNLVIVIFGDKFRVAKVLALCS